MLLFIINFLLLLGLVQAVPLASGESASSDYWLASIQHQGSAPFSGNAQYNVFRNVKDFGAKGMYSSTCCELLYMNILIVLFFFISM